MLNQGKEENLAAQSQINRQGRGQVINGKNADDILNILKDDDLLDYTNNQRLTIKYTHTFELIK